MDSTPQLETGRKAFESRSWREAHQALRAAREAGPLEALDLWRLALASYLAGDEAAFLRAAEEAHRAYVEVGDIPSAVRCAFWLGLHLAERAETARASGWFGRAARLLDRADSECVERGYMLVPAGHQQLIAGDYEACVRTAAEAESCAERFGDDDLLTLALHLRGRALLRNGDVEEGLALLDEAMVAVASDTLSPQVTGLVYCSVIGACREVYSVRRAQEWTGALAAWCARQPDMVPYSGECRVYRAEILQRHGAWRETIEEARSAVERMAGSTEMGARGLAFYHQGEAHRLLGELAAAEEAYREASRCGREPQPGLALLRLAQGNAAAAAPAIRRALSETADPLPRARLLPAHIEVMLEVGEVAEARSACEELAEIADAYGTEVLAALVAQSRGAIALASGTAREALPPLRRACSEWRALDEPYHAARTRELLGLACRELGDEDGAAFELEAARAELERLGAGPDLERLDARIGRRKVRSVHGLTPREREVLALLATGRTNRAIADALSISEKTVARHVANIYGKLGLASRSAATAYAYEHDLLDAST